MLTKVSPVIDKLLLFLVSVFFAIAVAGYFIRDTLLIALVAITSALSVTALVGLYKDKKNKGTKQKEIELSLLQFYFKTKDFALDALCNALSRRYKCKIYGEFIIINDIAIYPYLKPKALDLETFCSVFSKLLPSSKRLVVVTSKGKHPGLSKDIDMINLPFEVTFLSGEQTYTLLERLKGLPKIEYELKPARRTAKEFFKGALSPKVARRYLLTALLLIASSFFMPTSIYFMLFGAICLLLAVLSKINILDKVKSN